MVSHALYMPSLQPIRHAMDETLRKFKQPHLLVRQPV